MSNSITIRLKRFYPLLRSPAEQVMAFYCPMPLELFLLMPDIAKILQITFVGSGISSFFPNLFYTTSHIFIRVPALKLLYHTCYSHHTMVTSRRGTLSPCLCIILRRGNHFSLTLMACGLSPIVLNTWSYLRLPYVCYPVADLPCRSGIITRQNYRPCPAASPIIFLKN